MRYAATFVILLAIPARCLATGWADYSIKLGDGYEIVRCNSIDVPLCRNGFVILSPTNCPDVGPIVKYAVTRRFIFVETVGSTSRKRQADGRVLETVEIDPTRQFFFILVKGEDRVFGPLAKADFDAHPTVKGADKVSWRIRRNPMPFRPVAMLLPLPIVFVVEAPLLALSVILLALLAFKRLRCASA
jgi:hypothetical protein